MYSIFLNPSFKNNQRTHLELGVTRASIFLQFFKKFELWQNANLTLYNPVIKQILFGACI